MIVLFLTVFTKSFIKVIINIKVLSVVLDQDGSDKGELWGVCLITTDWIIWIGSSGIPMGIFNWLGEPPIQIVSLFV